MIQQIVLWLLRWLETSLDPELESRIEALNEKVADNEIARGKLIEQVSAAERELFQLSVTLADDLRKRKELEDAIDRSKEETAKKLAELDGLSGDDKLHVDL